MAQAVQVAFGLLSVGIERGRDGPPARPLRRAPGTRRDATPLMDAAHPPVGTAWRAARLSGRIAVTRFPDRPAARVPAGRAAFRWCPLASSRRTAYRSSSSAGGRTGRTRWWPGLLDLDGPARRRSMLR